MHSILTDLSDGSLALAVKANLYAFFRLLGRAPQAEFSEQDRLARWRTRVPHFWFNGVLCTRAPQADETLVIEDTLAYFRQRGVSGFTWWPETGVDVHAWAQALAPHGFRLDANTPGMALALADLPATPALPDGLVIRPVGDLAALREWAHAFVLGYGLPAAWEDPFYDLMAGLGLDLPLRYYTGYLHGQPVAVSTLFLAAGVAGLYNVATLPEARGLGYRASILQSSEMGLRVYQRLGFRTVCQMAHLFWADAR